MVACGCSFFSKRRPKRPALFFGRAPTCPAAWGCLHWAALRETGDVAANVSGSETSQASHEWPVRVYYEDTDCGGVVYHTSYLRFMERARTEWLRQLGFEQRHLSEATDRLFVVRGITVNYHRPAVLDDALTIASSAYPQGRARVVFEQTARRDGPTPEVCCHARVEIVCVRASDNRPCPFPERLQAEFADVG